MNERIKKLRKALDLTQEEFAQKLGTARNNIAGYETGKRSPSVAVITLICKTFNVSEKWLRTGKGEMFIQRTRDEELTALVDDLLSSESEDFRHRLITALLRLTPEQWTVMEAVTLNLLGEQAAAPAAQPAAPDQERPAAVPGWKPMTDAEIDAELESYRQELLAEREAGERSSASPSGGGNGGRAV